MQVIEVFGIGKTVGELIGVAVMSGFGAYFGSYLSKKGEGLATKEDIGEITKIVESVRDGYARDLAKLSEALRAQTSLRLLAGERRLDTHQKAYMLWREMINNVHEKNIEKRAKIKSDCRDFFFENCLYLDPKVRETFLTALGSFDVHSDLTEGQDVTWGDSRVRLAQAITENFARVRALGDAITEACELPSIAGKPETFMDDSQSK